MSRVMCEITSGTREVQEDYQALKKIGEVLQRVNFAETIKQIAQQHGLINDEADDRGEAVKVGDQFLRVIAHTSESEDQQHHAHRYLIYLHQIALDIVR